MGLIAWLTQFRAVQGWDEREQAIAAGQAMSERAIASDEGEPWGWAGRGCVGFTLRQPAIAIPALEHAVEIAPSFAFGHGLLSLAFSFAGCGGEALARLGAAVRLSPQELFQGSFAQQYAFAYFQQCNYTSALKNSESAHQLRPGHLYPLVVAAASAAHLDRADAADTFVGKLKAVAPNATAGWFDSEAPYVLQEDRSRLSEGLRRAGLS